MILKKNDFQLNLPSSNSFKKTEDKLRKTRKRKIVAILFFGTTLISGLLYFQSKIKNWQQQLFQPTTYRIINSNNDNDQLKEFIGFQPVLKNQDDLIKSITLLLNNLSGTYGIYFYQFDNQQSFGINDDKIYTAASVIKVPIMVNFYQEVEAGILKENSIYSLRQSDVLNYGTGILRYEKIGSKYEYKKLVELSGKKSDNTAAYVLEQIIGRKKIQSRLDNLGLENTSIQDNTTTPKEMGNYFKLLFENKLISQENKNKVFDFLIATDFEDRLPQGIPANVQIAHKIGNEIQTYNDCGIIFGKKPYILCVLSKEVKEDEALKAIPKISRLVWEYVDK